MQVPAYFLHLNEALEGHLQSREHVESQSILGDNYITQFCTDYLGIDIAPCGIQVEIPPGVLLVLMNISFRVFRLICSAKIDNPLEVVLVAIPRAICKPYR
jgi:hypothetical protein